MDSDSNEQISAIGTRLQIEGQMVVLEPLPNAIEAALKTLASRAASPATQPEGDGNGNGGGSSA